MGRREVIEQIDYIITILYSQDKNVYEEFLKIYTEISSMYEEFLKLIPALNQIGLEINADELLEEMREVSDAIKYKDKVLLYDTLKFKVINTLSQYDKIMGIMEE